MKEILNLYRSKYKFIDFYDLLSVKILNNNLINSNYHFENTAYKDVNFIYETKNNDIRIDLPIWFGNPKHTKLKIMILGREPRDSNDKYNVEINPDDKYVFGSPFGIECWTDKNKYYRSFKNVISNPQILTYFTDAVKKYEVKNSKAESDINAKTNFWKTAENSVENFEFLKREIEILAPDVLIGLGNDSYNFLQTKFGDQLKVRKIIHPNARQDKASGKNAWVLASEELDKIIEE